METFNDIFMDCTSLGTKIPKEEYLVNGKHIVVDQGQNTIAGYTDLDDGLFEDVPAIIFGDHTRVIKYVDEPFFLGADGVKLLKSKKQDANYKYLYYALKNARIPDTGYNRHFKWLKEVSIEYPNLNRQKEIVEVLDKITKIIEERKLELLQLDELIKARFVEMFGELEKNDKGWEERPLLDVCNQLKRYPTFCNMDYLKQGTRVIRIGNILLDGHMDIDDNNYVFVYDSVNEDFPDTVISLDDIVMAVRGDGSAAKRIGIIQEDKLVGANISPNLIRIQANTSVVAPIFLFHYLISEVGQKRLDSYVNKTAKKNIAAKDIAKVKTPVPEMYLQNEYVEFVKQVDKSKVVIQKSLDETQLLFDSLMQKYFG